MGKEFVTVQRHPLRAGGEDSDEDNEVQLIDGVQVPSWILDMRAGWTEEIKIMPHEKQEYFKRFDENESKRVRDHMRNIITATYKNVYEASFFKDTKRSTPRYFFRGVSLFSEEWEDQHNLYNETIRGSTSSSEHSTSELYDMDGSLRSLPGSRRNSMSSSKGSNSSTPEGDMLDRLIFSLPEIGSADSDTPITPIKIGTDLSLYSPSRRSSVSSASDLDDLDSYVRTPPSTPPPGGDLRTSPIVGKPPQNSSRRVRSTFDGVTMGGEEPKKRSRKKTVLAKIFKHGQGVQKQSEAEIRRHLEMYQETLENDLTTINTSVNEARKKEKAMLMSMTKELEELTATKRYQVRELYRRYMRLRILQAQWNQKLQTEFKLVLKDRSAMTKEALQCPEGTLPAYVSDDFFKNVNELRNCHPDLNAQFIRLNKVDKIVERLEAKYVSARKSARGKTQKERSLLIARLFKDLKTEEDLSEGTFVDAMEDEITDKFGAIVGDNRTTEGRWIQTFLTELHSHTIQRIPPSEIIGYIESYVKFMCKQHNISESKRPVLGRLVERHVYSLIFSELLEVEKNKHMEEDAHTTQQIEYLKTLSPLALGVEPKFLDDFVRTTIESAKKTYAEPINTLEFLGYCTSPVDMLLCIHITAKQVHKIARRNCEKHGYKFSFGADEFFPIFVYVVVHSDVPNLHSILSLLTKYANVATRSNEISYFFTCLEGAVAYIDQITKDQMESFKAVKDHVSDEEDEVVADEEDDF